MPFNSLKSNCPLCGKAFEITHMYLNARDAIYGGMGETPPDTIECVECLNKKQQRWMQETNTAREKAGIRKKYPCIYRNSDSARQKLDAVRDYFKLMAEKYKTILGDIDELNKKLEQARAEKQEIIDAFSKELSIQIAPDGGVDAYAHIKETEQYNYYFVHEKIRNVKRRSTVFGYRKADLKLATTVGRKSINFLNHEIYKAETSVQQLKEKQQKLREEIAYRLAPDSYFEELRTSLFKQVVSTYGYTQLAVYDSEKLLQHHSFLLGKVLFTSFYTNQKELFSLAKKTSNLTFLEVQSGDTNTQVDFFLPVVVDIQKCAGLLAEKNFANSFKSYFVKILQMMPVGGCEYLFFDPVSNGQSFGELNELVSPTGGGLVDRIYCEKQEIGNAFSALAKKIQGINMQLKDCPSVYEYNKTHEQKINPTVVVAFNLCEDSYDDSQLRAVLENAQRCGIFLILSYDKKRCYKEKSNYNGFYYEPNDKVLEVCLEFVNQGKDSLKHMENAADSYSELRLILTDDCYNVCAFEVAGYSVALAPWLANYTAHIKENSTIKNDYHDIDGKLPAFCSGDSTNGISIPFAIDRYNQIVNFNIAKPLCYHAFISGKTGVGKSVLLHALVAGVIRNYHPDDVELWLVDYKAVEFAEYAVHQPPHIKLIGLDNSKEFTFSFLDKLWETMEQRKRQMMQVGLTDIVAYKKRFGKNSIPRIVLIVDEAHKLSQHLAEEPQYKILFENLLSECRALGLSIILSDQAFENSMSGITPKGRNQINVRVAMANSTEEVRAILALDHAQYNEQPLKSDIQSLGQGDAIYKWDEQADIGKTIAHKDKVKVIFTKNEPHRRQIIDKAMVVASNYQQKNPWIIDNRERNALTREKNPMEHLSYLSSTPKRIEVVLGKPSSLDESYSIEAVRRRNANFILCADDDDILLSVAYFTAVSFYQQTKAKIFIIAGEDMLPKAFSKYFTQTFGSYVSISQTMSAYQKALDQIAASDATSLIIWLGIDEIIDAMQMLEAKPAKQATVSQPKNDLGADIFELQNLCNSLTGQESAPVDNPFASAGVSATAVQEYYDRSDEIIELLDKGSFRSQFSFVLTYTIKDIARIKAIKMDYFEHKFACNIAGNDSLRLFGTAKKFDIDSNVVEQTVVHSDGYDFNFFRPYKMVDSYISLFASGQSQCFAGERKESQTDFNHQAYKHSAKYDQEQTKPTAQIPQVGDNVGNVASERFEIHTLPVCDLLSYDCFRLAGAQVLVAESISERREAEAILSLMQGEEKPLVLLLDNLSSVLIPMFVLHNRSAAPKCYVLQMGEEMDASDKTNFISRIGGAYIGSTINFEQWQTQIQKYIGNVRKANYENNTGIIVFEQ